MNLKNAVSSITGSVSKHTPEILTGFGIAGMATATVLAVKATPKALRLIDEAENEFERGLTTKETIQATWKCYIPTAVTMVVSAGCMIGASTVNYKRNAALATAYKVTETALSEVKKHAALTEETFSEYKKQTVETVGEKKEKVIQEKTQEELTKRHPVMDNEVILTSNDQVTCKDAVSGRYFASCKNDIEAAVNVVNSYMNNYNYTSLSDFYGEIGLEPTTVSEEIGWNLDDGLICPVYTSTTNKHGVPALCVDFRVRPHYDYQQLYR